MGGNAIRAKCSLCQTKFKQSVHADGFVLCPGCGARLQYRKPPPTGGTAKPPEMTQELTAAVVAARMERGRQESESARVADPQPKPAPPPTPPDQASTQAGPAPNASAPTAPASDRDKETDPTPESSIEELMFALYQTQKQMLEILQERLGPVPTMPEDAPESNTTPEGNDFAAFPPAPTRASGRKSVLLIDDDDTSRAAAVAALEKAEVLVRTAVSGQAAIDSLAQETPDVIALEGEMSGKVSGGDIVDRVRSVMEWVNIPILLYTQARLKSQEDARTLYGADGYVLKDPRTQTLSYPR